MFSVGDELAVGDDSACVLFWDFVVWIVVDDYE